MWGKARDMLLWHGEPDPPLTQVQIRSDDPKLRDLAAIIDQWELHLTLGDPYTVRQIIDRAVWQAGMPQPTLFGEAKMCSEAQDLREAWLVVAGKNGSINSGAREIFSPATKGGSSMAAASSPPGFGTASCAGVSSVSEGERE